MSRTRKLTLRKETLVELAATDLGSVVGASGPSCNICPTECTSCGSDFQACFTNECVPTIGCVQTAAPAC